MIVVELEMPRCEVLLDQGAVLYIIHCIEEPCYQMQHVAAQHCAGLHALRLTFGLMCAV